MDWESEALLARGESGMMAIWSQAFSQPTVEFAEYVCGEQFIVSIRNLFSTCEDESVAASLDVLEGYLKRLAGEGAEKVRLALEVEYNKLFVGPGKLLAPPYESYYATSGGGRSGRVNAKPAWDVREEYRVHGLKTLDSFPDFPDHIAVELEYLSVLALREAEAWEAHDRNAAVALQEAAETFKCNHLAKWLPSLRTRILVGAKVDFYPCIAVLVEKSVLHGM